MATLIHSYPAHRYYRLKCLLQSPQPLIYESDGAKRLHLLHQGLVNSAKQNRHRDYLGIDRHGLTDAKLSTLFKFTHVHMHSNTSFILGAAALSDCYIDSLQCCWWMKKIWCVFVELVWCLDHMRPITIISSANPQTAHFENVKGAVSQRMTQIFWQTEALMERKPIRLLQNDATDWGWMCVSSPTVRVGWAIESDSLCWHSSNQFVQQICSLMALETKYKHSESCHKLLQTVWLLEWYRSGKNQTQTHRMLNNNSGLCIR